MGNQRLPSLSSSAQSPAQSVVGKKSCSSLQGTPPGSCSPSDRKQWLLLTLTFVDATLSLTNPGATEEQRLPGLSSSARTLEQTAAGDELDYHLISYFSSSTSSHTGNRQVWVYSKQIPEAVRIQKYFNPPNSAIAKGEKLPSENLNPKLPL